MASCTPTTTARAAATNSAVPFSIPTNRFGRECGDASGPSDWDTALAPDVFPCVALLLGVRILGSLARLECCAGTGFASASSSTADPSFIPFAASLVRFSLDGIYLSFEMEACTKGHYSARRDYKRLAEPPFDE